MKKIITLIFLLMCSPIFAGQLSVISSSTKPAIIVVNGQNIDVYAMQSGKIEYAGFTVTVKLYDPQGNFIKEDSIETPTGKAMILIFTSESGEYDMKLSAVNF